MDGDSAERPDLSTKVKTADALINLNALHAVKSGFNVLLSCLATKRRLLYVYSAKISSILKYLKELWIRAGVVDSTRYILVHILAPRTGNAFCYLLQLVHALTGCYYTSKVGTKHAALNANPCEYLKDFDCGPNCSAV
jgi:hypothetical protein